MEILTSERSRRASAARASISWRERVLAVNNTTPWLMTVRCQPLSGARHYRGACRSLGSLTRSPEPPSPPRAALGQHCELGAQRRRVGTADHRGGAGVGEIGIEAALRRARLVVRRSVCLHPR